jgi:hypothetical protein
MEMEHTYLLETDATRTASLDYRAFISTIRRVIHDEGAAVTRMRISVDGTSVLGRWPAYDGSGAQYRYLPECTDDQRGIITVLMGWMQVEHLTTRRSFTQTLSRTSQGGLHRM